MDGEIYGFKGVNGDMSADHRGVTYEFRKADVSEVEAQYARLAGYVAPAVVRYFGENTDWTGRRDDAWWRDVFTVSVEKAPDIDAKLYVHAEQLTCDLYRIYLSFNDGDDASKLDSPYNGHYDCVYDMVSGGIDTTVTGMEHMYEVLEESYFMYDLLVLAVDNLKEVYGGKH